MKLVMRGPSVAALASTLAVSVLLGACGQKGPLLPAPAAGATAAAAAAAAAASQVRGPAVQSAR